MNLANHNAAWNSKKGAAFGFSSIAARCGEDLKEHLHEIIPKLFRYQYDPTPNIQLSMQNIWKVLVSEPQKTVSVNNHLIIPLKKILFRNIGLNLSLLNRNLLRDFLKLSYKNE